MWVRIAAALAIVALGFGVLGCSIPSTATRGSESPDAANSDRPAESREWLVPEDTLLDQWARGVASRLPLRDVAPAEAPALLAAETGYVELHEEEYTAALAAGDDGTAATALTGLAWHALQRGLARLVVSQASIDGGFDPAEDLELAAADLQWQVVAGLADERDVAMVARVWLLAAIFRTSTRSEALLPTRQAIRLFDTLIDGDDEGVRAAAPRPQWLHERGIAHHLRGIAQRRRGLDCVREFRLAVFDHSDAMTIWPAHDGFRLARASAALGLGESRIAGREDGLHALRLAIADTDRLLHGVRHAASATPTAVLARLIRAESQLHAGTFVKGLRERERKGRVHLPDGFPDDGIPRLQAAATDFLVVMQLNSGDAATSDAALGLGRCLMRLRRLDEAILVLDNALRLDPANPRVVIARRIAGIMADQR